MTACARPMLPPEDGAESRRARVRHERVQRLDDLAQISEEAGLYNDGITRNRLRR